MRGDVAYLDSIPFFLFGSTFQMSDEVDQRKSRKCQYHLPVGDCVLSLFLHPLLLDHTSASCSEMMRRIVESASPVCSLMER